MTLSFYKEISSVIMSDTVSGEAGSKLFPSQGSKLVFVSYMLMFVAQVVQISHYYPWI